MPLISCPECRREVSSKAPTCPSCGCPLAAQTIEATAKQWKAAQLVCAIFAIVGVIVAVSRGGGYAGGIMLVAGIGGFVAARMAAWWHHG